MTVAAHTIEVTAVPATGRVFKVAGLGIVMAVPALFWTAVAAVAAPAVGIAASATALIATGGAVALFVGAVCAPVMLKA